MKIQTVPWQIKGEKFPKIQQNEKCDVLVIGAGITGLTTAYELSKKRLKVIVVERGDRVGFGTTGQSSAHLSSLWDMNIVETLEAHGIEAIETMVKAMREAISYIAETSEFAQDGAEFEIVPGYFYSNSQAETRRVENTFKVYQKLHQKVKVIDDIPLPIDCQIAMEIENQAHFHPLKYLYGLTKKIKDQGGRIFINSPVDRLEEDKAFCGDYEIMADNFVHATHIPLGINPLQGFLSPMKSFVLTGEINYKLPRALFWDTASPYHYLRTYEKNGSSWVMLGGFDKPEGSKNEMRAIEELKNYATKQFPGVKIDKVWGSQFYSPTDRLPYIGKLPFSTNHFCATGFSGDGLTLGTASGRFISRAIISPNTEFKWIKVFSPSRMSALTEKSFYKQTYKAVKNLVAERIAKPNDNPKELKRGEGLVSSGANPKAYYCEENGRIKSFSAVCPHMGCIIQWNSLEKTFDCPCHGSSFTSEGKPIRGPAMKSIEVA